MEGRPRRLRPDEVPGWDRYPETVLLLGDRALAIDLRTPVPPSAVRACSRLGLAGPFVVVTAANPPGRAIGVDEAERRHAALAGDLRAAGAIPIRADGRSPDGRHREPGWAAALPVAEAVRIAAAYGQAAIFRWDGRRFLIEPVLVDASVIPLPVPR